MSTSIAQRQRQRELRKINRRIEREQERARINAEAMLQGKNKYGLLDPTPTTAIRLINDRAFAAGFNEETK